MSSALGIGDVGLGHFSHEVKIGVLNCLVYSVVPAGISILFQSVIFNGSVVLLNSRRRNTRTIDSASELLPGEGGCASLRDATPKIFNLSMVKCVWW